jgi:hypothetical protein
MRHLPESCRDAKLPLMDPVGRSQDRRATSSKMRR